MNKYFKKLFSVELDNSCVEYRALASIFNSDKSEKEKAKLYNVYIPGIKDKDSIQIILTLTKILEEKDKKCNKFLKKNHIKNKKEYMDKSLGLSQTLQLLDKTGNKLKTKTNKRPSTTGSFFKTSVSSR